MIILIIMITTKLIKGGKEMNNSKVVAIRLIYDDVDKVSRLTNIPKAKLLEIAWEEFKKTKRYSKIMLGLE